MLSIHKITDKSQWETFIFSQTPNSFLQSWNWGEMQENLGNKIFRLGISEEDKLVGVGLIIKVIARRGTFLHCAYGPNLDWNEKEQFKVFVEYLKGLAKKEKASFLRINPLLENNEENKEIFKSGGFRNAPIHLVNPELSWIKDLNETEEEIMKNFKKDTRYEIRKAEKLGIKVSQSNDLAALDRFYAIHLDTVKRHHFVPYSYDFLKAQLANFTKDNQIKIFEAEYEKKIIASAIIMFYGEEASYHHAASLSEYNRIPSSYLIQWEIIKEAKKRDLKKYNFWGIVENQSKHPWAGLSLFKQKFGGSKKEYLHVQDLPINCKYYGTWLIEKIRRIKRGY